MCGIVLVGLSGCAAAVALWICDWSSSSEPLSIKLYRFGLDSLSKLSRLAASPVYWSGQVDVVLGAAAGQAQGCRRRSCRSSDRGAAGTLAVSVMLPASNNDLHRCHVEYALRRASMRRRARPRSMNEAWRAPRAFARGRGHAGLLAKRRCVNESTVSSSRPGRREHVDRVAAVRTQARPPRAHQPRGEGARRTRSPDRRASSAMSAAQGSGKSCALVDGGRAPSTLALLCRRLPRALGVLLAEELLPACCLALMRARKRVLTVRARNP